MNRILLIIVLAVATSIGKPRAFAEPQKEDAQKPKPPVSIPVAILEFESTAQGNADLGKQVSEMLGAMLSGEDGFELVDRTSINRALAETELNLSGLVSVNQATKVGKLVGAKILISGKIYLLDKQLILSAKLVGTETSRLEVAQVEGDKDAKVMDLMHQLAKQVADLLRKKGPKLIASPDPMDDPLPALKKALAGRKLPKVAVHIQERHVTTAPAIRVDPAVETEIEKVLKDAGFSIFDGNDKDLADAGVGVVITGDAFSEFAARIGNLVSCSARVELKVSDRKTGEIILVDRQVARGVDLAENLAGKSALQNAGHVAAIRILRELAEKLPKSDAP